MKHNPLFYVVSFVIILAFTSCQNRADSQSEMKKLAQMDLASLKSLLSKKKSEIAVIQGEIDTILARMEELDPAMNRKKAQRVTILPVVDTVFEKYITVQGLLEADETLNVNAEAGGRLIELKIEEGDYVEKGELVGRINLEQLSKQKAELETSYELAKEVFQRQKRLWDQNIGSEMQYLQAKNDMERLERSLETLEYEQSKSEIFAPISGVVDAVNIREGELVAPGEPIAVILDIRQLIATADVPENYLSQVQVGDEVTVRFPSLDAETTGRISLIGNKIDKANRTFEIEVGIRRFTKNLKPNMLTEIQLNTSTVKNVVTIPINLIQQEINGREYLLIVDRSSGEPKAKKTYITKGETNDLRAIITEGIVPGDEVIEIGGRTVSAGAPLDIIEKSVLISDPNQPMNE
ncbi:efflux RND transporter periplasmic adaptor subunit [Membranicola marinus]|uniref:Efflux RND transporter periplasmic adaptor subunit n=1 Tax=Membranihabitans marinus TaxID=1227546 RepID=A0A953LC68_9BACT|nr:efflux RND transporter periplasmic adaptor subunit [Membranihabitans marinus]MBY5957449.1 efflux RND transporter periplasmic adaptor subunit [Membranihabitans marinus]